MREGDWLILPIFDAYAVICFEPLQSVNSGEFNVNIGCHSVECQSVKVKRAAVCQNGGCCYHGFGIKAKKRTVEDQKGHCTKELF